MYIKSIESVFNKRSVFSLFSFSDLDLKSAYGQVTNKENTQKDDACVAVKKNKFHLFSNNFCTFVLLALWTFPIDVMTWNAYRVQFYVL